MNKTRTRNKNFRALATMIDQTWLKTRDSEYSEMVRQYRCVEAEFIERGGDDEFFLLEMRRRVAEAILREATAPQYPFEHASDAWKDLLSLGFTNIDQRCMMSWFFANCCLRHKHSNEGLAVVEPLIADLEEMRARLSKREFSQAFYEDHHGGLSKLRDRLRALPK